MQHIRLSAFSFVLLAALCGASAAEPPKATPIAFAKSGDHAETKGKFKAPKTFTHDYTVELKAGQTYSVHLDDGKDHITYFNVFAPGASQKPGEGRTRYDVKVAKDGVYTIHVFMTKSAVTKGASSSWELAVDRKS